MKTLAYWLAAATLLTPAAALALDDEMMFPTDSRIRMLPYDESDVYTITTKYGYQTNLVFGPQEEIYTISIGDRSLWQVIPSGNRLFIRPMHEDVLTNMTVLTNKHSYYFDLKSVGDDSKSSNIIYVAKFVYPEDMARQPKPAEASPYDRHMSTALPTPPAMSSAAVPVASAAVVAGKDNYNYTYSGSDALAPLKVFDDGKSTFFQYSASTQPPSTYIVAQDGSEKPVAHYMKDGYLVVDDVAGEWLLKSAGGSILVYNETRNRN